MIAILAMVLLVVTFAAMLAAVTGAVMAALAVVVAVAVVLFGFTLPRDVLRRLWAKANTPDPRDHAGRAPLQSMYEDFLTGFRRG